MDLETVTMSSITESISAFSSFDIALELETCFELVMLLRT